MSLPATKLVPIFPLNLVLYPGMYLPLHIFEKRYRAMVQYCLENESPFGVVLIAQGLPEGDKVAEPYSIGATAKIIQIQKTAPDRMNIWTLGTERFELLDYSLSADKYLIGRIKLLPDNLTDSALYNKKTDAINRAFKHYLDLRQTLNSQDNQKLNYQLSSKPDVLSYQIAANLNISLAEKQNLLEFDNVADRLSAELKILEREIAYLQDMLKAPQEKTVKLPWGGDINLN